MTRNTPRDKTRVMAVGVFDLIHLGHVYYLTEARKLGDELVVVVATDASAARRKHEPILPQEMRAALVAALKPVDFAVVGHPDDQYRTVEDLRPDVIALGWDDYHKAEEIRAELAKRGLGDVEVARLPKLDQEHDLAGTRRIVRRIMELYRAAPMAPPSEKAASSPQELRMAPPPPPKPEDSR